MIIVARFLATNLIGPNWLGIKFLVINLVLYHIYTIIQTHTIPFMGKV